MKLKISALCALGAVALALLAVSSAPAKDLQYPVACYQGDELKKVQAWETTWVGKKVSSANVDQVKEFLPESFYDLMKDTAKWGETWFEIVPYLQIPSSPGKIAMTREHSGKSTIGPSGEILGYVSGVPFPEPGNDPLKIAHNFRMRNYGDTLKTNEFGFIVDGRLKYDMNVEIHNNYCFFSGRNDLPPVPEFPNNPKQIWRAFSMLQLAPPETRNLRIMEVHYKDSIKAYDSWFWMPSIRRVRRRSTTERQDAQGGADFCGYDNMGWDGPVHFNNYRYIINKEYLLTRHSDASKLKHTAGECMYSGTQRERIKVHVIEATSKDTNFLYSKMVWYVDPETYQVLYSDRYDRQGKLWKVLDQFCYVDKGYNGVPVDWFNGSQMIDVQRRHSTLASASYTFGEPLEQSMFTLDYLQKHGY